MNDGLNYNDICCTETVYFIMFGLKMFRAELMKLPRALGNRISLG